MSHKTLSGTALCLMLAAACQGAPGHEQLSTVQLQWPAMPESLPTVAPTASTTPDPVLQLETQATQSLATETQLRPTPYPALTPHPAPTPHPAFTPHPPPPPRVQSPPPPPPEPTPTPKPPEPLAAYRPQVAEYVFHEAFSYNPYSNIHNHVFFDQTLSVHFTPGQKVLIFGGPVSPPNLNRVLCCVGADDWIRFRVNGNLAMSWNAPNNSPHILSDAIDVTNSFVPGFNKVQFQAGNTFIPTAWVTPLILRVISMPSPSYLHDTGMRFGYIMPGSLSLGGRVQDGGPDDERPLYAVSVKGYYLQQTEVTQQQWLDVMGEWPGEPPDADHGLGPHHPAYNVSWQDVQDFIARLNAQGEGRYRLPTETEWEYAARTRSNTTWGCGNEESCLAERAWYGSQGAQPVAQKSPALWEPEKTPLYDMQGNVAEWVNDWYGPYQDAVLTDPQGPLIGTDKVIRGGHWQDTPVNLRPATRQKAPPENRSPLVGFRLVWEP